MNWYYVDQGQQAGPVDDATLEQYRASGKIQPDTLVWREGMANWIAYSEAKAEAKPAGLRLAGSTAGAAGTAGSSATATAEATCTECGGTFPVENLIRYGTANVCANCKPAFMQKLAEGAKIQTGGLEYASIGTRFAAVVLDGILLWIVGTAIQFALGAMSPRGTFGVAQIVSMALQLLIGMTYEAVMIGKYGATLGKMACKIKVVTADGGKVSYPRAFGRYFAKILSQMICFIGYLMAVFDKEEHRSLHDRMCNTRVVMK